MVHNQHSMTDDNVIALEPVSIDATLNVLADPTRRRLLDRLRETEELTIAQATAEFADGGGTDTDTTTSERERIEISLRHVHLPKMADVGVIDWDPETGRIDATPNSQEAYDLLAI